MEKDKYLKRLLHMQSVFKLNNLSSKLQYQINTMILHFSKTKTDDSDVHSVEVLRRYLQFGNAVKIDCKNATTLEQDYDGAPRSDIEAFSAIFHQNDSIFEIFPGESYEKKPLQKRIYCWLEILCVTLLQQRIEGRMSKDDMYPANISSLSQISDLLHKEYESFIAEYPQFGDLTALRIGGGAYLLKLWKCIYGYPFEPSSVSVSSKIAKLSKTLKEAGIAVEQQPAFVCAVKRLPITDRDDEKINHPILYLRKMLGRNLASLSPDTTPAEDMLDLEDTIRETRQAIKNVDELEFLRALFYKRSKNDLALENSFCFTMMKPYLMQESTDYIPSNLVIHPNPDFVGKCMKDAKLSPKDIAFVVESKEIACLYKNKYRDYRFFYWCNITSQLEAVKATEEEEYQPLKLEFISVAWFYCGKEYETKLLDSIRCEMILLFAPNSQLDARLEGRILRESLLKKRKIKSVSLMPSKEMKLAKCQKKCMLISEICTDSSSQQEEILFKKFRIEDGCLFPLLS